jgi:hypothetical protein
VLAHPRRREGGLLARVPVLPLVGGHDRGGVRRVLERVVGLVGAALLDLADLLADRDQRVAEAVELGLRLALGGLDHQRARDREAHRRRVEAVVHQALGDVLDLDARAPSTAQSRMNSCATRPFAPRVEHRVVALEALRHVVGVEDRDLGRAASPSAPIIAM